MDNFYCSTSKIAPIYTHSDGDGGAGRLLSDQHGDALVPFVGGGCLLTGQHRTETSLWRHDDQCITTESFDVIECAAQHRIRREVDYPLGGHRRDEHQVRIDLSELVDLDGMGVGAHVLHVREVLQCARATGFEAVTALVAVGSARSGAFSCCRFLDHLRNLLSEIEVFVGDACLQQFARRRQADKGGQIYVCMLDTVGHQKRADGVFQQE